MYEVITIGSATLDVFLKSPAELENIDGKSELCFPKGAKLEVSEVVFETGGGATNTATTFARQGLSTACICKIGNDLPGSKVLEFLKNERISTDLIVKDDQDTTDFSTIIWTQAGGSVILVNRGKTSLTHENIPIESLQPKWFFITSTEGNVSIIEKLIHQDHQSQIAWNPGKLELSQTEKVKSLIPHVSLFIVNKEEIYQFTETGVNEPIGSVLKKVASLSVKTALITAGHEGSYYFDGSVWHHADAFKIERKESTGAGDAFGSAFVAGLLQGLTTEQCLKLASANAASVVTNIGAKRGILTRKSSQEWLQKDLLIEEVNI
jgi:sugar/nucleoside kinase (ribokinase family)